MATGCWIAQREDDALGARAGPCGATLFTIAAGANCHVSAASPRRFWQEERAGPVLRVHEGEECAMLCNADEGHLEATDDLCIVEQPDTAAFEAREAAADEQGYDTCEGVRDFGIISHPVVPAKATVSRPSSGDGKGQAPEAAAAAAGNKAGESAAERDYDDEYDDDYGASSADEYDEAVAVEHRSSAGSKGGSGSGANARDEEDDFSDVGEPATTEVVYVREGVCVRPNEVERIGGRLSLIRQDAVLFLSWLPYSHGELRQDGTFRLLPEGGAATNGSSGGGSAAPQAARDRGRYAVHPLPLSEVKAIKRHTPSFGWHYVVLVLADGLTLPPLYFANGGVKALFSALKEHAFLVRSADDPNTFLVNDTADPLQRSLTSLELADVLLGGPPHGASTTFPPGVGGLPGSTSADAAHVPASCSGNGAAGAAGTSAGAHGGTPGPSSGGASQAPGAAPTGWGTCSSLAGVGGVSSVADGFGSFSMGMGFGADGAQRSTLRQVLEGFRQLARETTSSFFGAPGDDDDVPSEAALTAGPAALPASGSHGALAAAAAAAAAREAAAAAAGNEDALEERRRSGCEAATNVGVFELVERRQGASGGPGGAGGGGPGGRARAARPPPLSAEEWASFLDAEGRLVDEKGFRQRCFYGGVEPALRRTAWKFLLGVFEPGSTAAEREARMAERREEYMLLKSQWSTITPAQATRFAKWRERRSRVDKDVRRTDRSHSFYAGNHNQNVRKLRNILLTYCMYNFDLGYCQGMSDLASPLLAVMKDEADAFWAFAALMERMAPNFHTDCTGMHAQLLALRRLVQMLDPPLHAFLDERGCTNYFFCYRWLLIHFKREFAFEEVMRLWEAVWSRHASDHFHLFVCVAVLEQHRRAIMADPGNDFDALLKYCIALSGRLSLDTALRDAEVLADYAGEAGRQLLANLP